MLHCVYVTMSYRDEEAVGRKDERCSVIRQVIDAQLDDQPVRRLDATELSYFVWRRGRRFSVDYS